LKLTIRALAQLPIWVGWRIEIRNGRPVKIPYNPGNGRRAEADNPGTWRHRASAESWSSNSDGDGVGLMLAGVGDFHLGGIDLDTCRDKSGVIADWAREIIDRFASYTEISPSGAGLKIFFAIAKNDYDRTGAIFGSDGNGERYGRAFKNGGGAGEGKSPGIEVYRGLRYFTVTENVYGDNDELRCIDLADLKWLIGEVGPKFAGGGSAGGDKHRDESRSAAAWRAVWPMIKRGASYEKMREALLNHKVADVREWARTKGMAGGERELRRIYDRTVRDEESDFRIQTSEEFIADWQSPDWFVDGVLQRKFLYAMTGVTGHGKTAVAMRLANSVGEGSDWGGAACDKGDVIYFAGENPDDVRSRWIAMDGKRVHFIVGTQISLREDIALIKAEVERLGIAPSAIIVDTKAAFFEDEDEDKNVAAIQQAADLRELTGLPGNPAVLVLCHPTKYAKNTDQLQPRGGGAFVAAIDGNLTCIVDDSNIVTIEHTKLRGTTFDPLQFSLEMVELPERYRDTKGRRIKSVIAVTANETEIERKQKERDNEMEQVRKVRREHPELSLADIAKKLWWLDKDGNPQRWKVQRILKKLERED
jgi:hypothetical protein